MNEITNILPAKYAAYFAALVVITQFLGRVYHAMASGKGIIGAWRAFLYGNSNPPEKPPGATGGGGAAGLIIALLCLFTAAGRAQQIQLPSISLSDWTIIGGYGQSFSGSKQIAFGDVAYNFNKNVGIVAGGDQLWAPGQRQANVVKGGVTLSATIHPFAFIGSTVLTNVIGTPFISDLLATPKGGNSSIGNITTAGINFDIVAIKNLEIVAGFQVEKRIGQGYWDDKYWLAHAGVSRRF